MVAVIEPHLEQTSDYAQPGIPDGRPALRPARRRGGE
jgi:hypothetical protein